MKSLTPDPNDPYSPFDLVIRKPFTRETIRAAELHYRPQVGTMPCHECQLGDLEAAKVRLKRTFELEEEFRRVALDDEDLRPFWNSPSSTRHMLSL